MRHSNVDSQMRKAGRGQVHSGITSSIDGLAPIGAIPAQQRLQPAHVALQNFPHRRSFLIAKFARVGNIMSFDGAKSCRRQTQQSETCLDHFTLTRTKFFMSDSEESL